MHVLIYAPGQTPDEWAELVDAFPQIDFTIADSADAAVEAIRGAEVAIAMGGLIEPHIIAAAASLRWLQVASAGVDPLAAIPELRGGQIVVTNIQGLLATHVAETAVALLTALTRGVPYGALRQAEHRWTHDYPYDELADNRALVVGVGGIGRAVAKRYHGLDMRVRGVDVFPSAPGEYLEAVHPIDRLPELLPAADVLTICCPYTPATHHLIDAQALAALPADAYLINVARGRIVDTAAVADEIRAGRLRGVGLDVTEVEPLPPDSELWDLPRTLILPHVAGRSPRRQERINAFVIDNLGRYVRGDQLRNVVDLARGF